MKIKYIIYVINGKFINNRLPFKGNTYINNIEAYIFYLKWY